MAGWSRLRRKVVISAFASRSDESDRWASPGFPVDLFGVGELHAAFLNESRTRIRWRCPVTGNPGRPSFSAHVRFGERRALLPFPDLCCDLHFFFPGYSV